MKPGAGKRQKFQLLFAYKQNEIQQSFLYFENSSPDLLYKSLMNVQHIYKTDLRIQKFKVYSNKAMSEADENQGQQNRENADNIEGPRAVPPTLLRINADNQDKRSLCIFWSLFFFLVVFIGILSVTLPREINSVTNKLSLKQSALENCSNPSTFENGVLKCTQTTTNKIGIVLTEFTEANQFAIVQVHFEVEKLDKEVDIEENVKIELIELKEITVENKKSWQKISSKKSQHKLEIDSYDSVAYYDDDREHKGYSAVLYVIRKVQENQLLIITLEDKNFSDLPNIKEGRIEPQILTVNEQFSAYSIAIRIVYFLLSVVAAVVFSLNYFRIPPHERIIEQKFIALLTFLLLLFNDPFYAINVYNPNPASNFFSVFFIIDFVIVLLLSWIIFVDRIHYEDGQKVSQLKLWKRIGFAFVLYTLSLTLYVLYAFDTLDNAPIIPAHDLLGSNTFLGLEIIVILLVIVGIIYIMARAQNKLWRNQMFLFFSIFFIFITFLLFLVEGFRIYNYSAHRILLLYSEMNFYVFYLQYMYRVTGEELERIRKGHFENINQNRYLIKKDNDEVDLEIDDSENQFPPNNFMENSLDDSIKMQKEAVVELGGEEPSVIHNKKSKSTIKEGFDDFDLD